MKGFLSRDEVKKIKEQYPAGTRIELVHMDDPYSPIEPGMQGIVKNVDDCGTIHSVWDNGRTLGVIPGEDVFKIISKPSEEKLKEEDEQSMGGIGM